MSALSMYLGKENIIFATDTLSTMEYGFPYTPINHTSKVVYYPHLKCCVVALGSSKLGDDMHSFIQRMRGCDTLHLIENVRKHFLEFTDVNTHCINSDKDPLRDNNLIGDIYIMGASILENKMVAYDVKVCRDELTIRDMSLDDAVFVHPPVSPKSSERIWEGFKDEDPTIENVGEIMKKHVEQMAMDSLNPETFSVAVGLEIHVVNIQFIDGKFTCNFWHPQRFNDFTDDFIDLMNNFHKNNI